MNKRERIARDATVAVAVAAFQCDHTIYKSELDDSVSDGEGVGNEHYRTTDRTCHSTSFLCHAQ